MASDIKIIDPHVHLFDLQAGEYAWLKHNNPPFWSDKSTIVRSCDDTYLKDHSSFTLAAYVHIEAGFDNRQGHREIANIEQRATLPHRAIGHIDITLDPHEFMLQLGSQAQFKSAVGIRHILENTEQYSVASILENANSYTNLLFLAKHNGIFELQCDVTDRETVVHLFAFFQRLPTLQLVLNHAGFAPSAFLHTQDDETCGHDKVMREPNEALRKHHDILPLKPLGLLDGQRQLTPTFEDWKANLHLLAKLPNIAVKCSGFEMLVGESPSPNNYHYKRDYSVEQVEAVLTHCIEAFGYKNVMLASNFPLCELSHSYDAYWAQLLVVVERLVANKVLMPEQKKALYHDNAFSFYSFTSAPSH